MESESASPEEGDKKSEPKSNFAISPVPIGTNSLFGSKSKKDDDKNESSNFPISTPFGSKNSKSSSSPFSLPPKPEEEIKISDKTDENKNPFSVIS